MGVRAVLRMRTKDLLGKKEVSDHPEEITIIFARIIKTGHIDKGNVVSIQSELMGLYMVRAGF